MAVGLFSSLCAGQAMFLTTGEDRQNLQGRAMCFIRPAGGDFKKGTSECILFQISNGCRPAWLQ